MSDSNITSGIGGRVRMMRLAKPWSLMQLANESGVSKQWIWQIERGKEQPTWKTINKLAKALEVGIAWLATGQSEVSGEPEDQAFVETYLAAPVNKRLLIRRVSAILMED